MSIEVSEHKAADSNELGDEVQGEARAEELQGRFNVLVNELRGHAKPQPTGRPSPNDFSRANFQTDERLVEVEMGGEVATIQVALILNLPPESSGRLSSVMSKLNGHPGASVSFRDLLIGDTGIDPRVEVSLGELEQLMAAWKVAQPTTETKS